MLGGFLGAGKTTTILRLAQYLQRHGHRPELITNDQAERLVDTALLEELNRKRLTGPSTLRLLSRVGWEA